MSDTNGAVNPEEFASESVEDAVPGTPPIQENGAETADLPDWAKRQLEQSDAEPEGQKAAEEPVGPQESDETAGLPDWAVQKMSQMDGSEGAETSADQPESSDDTQLPSWAMEKMQQFAGDDTGVSEETAVPAPLAAAATETPMPLATGQPAGKGPDMPAQFAQYAPNLELMLDLPLDVSVELGHAELPLAHVLGLKAGSVVQLDRLPGEPLDLLVNGQLVARGEIVVLNDTFAFRVTDLIED